MAKLLIIYKTEQNCGNTKRLLLLKILPVPGLPRNAIWGALLLAIPKPIARRFSSKSIPLAHRRNCIFSSCNPTIWDIASSNSDIAFPSWHDMRAFCFLCSSIWWVRSSSSFSLPAPPGIWCKGILPSWWKEVTTNLTALQIIIWFKQII